MNILAVFAMTLPVLVPGLTLIIALKRGWGVRWRHAIDGGRTWRGRAILGQNKTWFGLVLYVVGGALVGTGLMAVGAGGEVFDNARGGLVGATVGGAYAVGELVNSLIKRRLNVSPGQVTPTRWAPLQLAVDLADGIVCAALVYALWGVPLLECAAVLTVGLGIHVGTDVLMYRLSLKRHQHERPGHRHGEVIAPPGADALDRG